MKMGSLAETKEPGIMTVQVQKWVRDICAKAGASSAVRDMALKLADISLSRSGQSGCEISDDEYLYFAACSILVASIVKTEGDRKHLPISTILSAAGGQLHVGEFFERARFAAADLGRVTSDIPAVDPTSVIQSHQQAFDVTGEVYRKFEESIVNVDLIQNELHVVRPIWIYFLVAKAFISRKCSTALASVSSFHLLLACIVQLGAAKEEGENDANEESSKRRKRSAEGSSGVKVENGFCAVKSLCKTTGGVQSEVRRFLGMVSQTLPKYVEEQIPIKRIDKDEEWISFSETVENLYVSLLRSSKECTGPDERIFIDNSNLTGSQGTVNPFSIMSPPRSQVLPINGVEGEDSNGFAKFVYPASRTYGGSPLYSGSGDALDALAAVASSSPRSPAVHSGVKAFKIPPTPVSAGLQAVAWLHRIARSRPEVKLLDEKKRGSLSGVDLVREATVLDENEPGVDITTETLRKMFEKFPEIWNSTVKRVKNLLSTLEPGVMQAGQRREAIALYFASLEKVVVKEDARLNHHQRLQALLENCNFHKTFLACALEATAACYGRRDISVFPLILDSFNVSAFTLTKGIESFVRSLPNLPRRVGRHIVTSEHRLLESVVWEPTSPLVTALRTRDESMQRNADNEEPCATPGVPDAALEILYRKILFITGERIDALASLLGLDQVVEQVWEATKTALVEKWSLLIGRHLDQIILCCIYGIARVFRIPLKFKDITTQYRMLDHVNDPSFQHLIPGVYRDVCVNEHRGDIIKFYNEVFVPSMKESLMGYQPAVRARTSPVTDSPSPGTPVDRLRRSIMSSPLRVSRSTPLPTRQFGAQITVSPMSPHARSLRHSPSRLLGRGFLRTPQTRTLYAFGESPSHDHSRMNRPFSTGESSASSRPLSLDIGTNDGSIHTGASSIRRRYASILASQGVKQVRKITDTEENKKNSIGDQENENEDSSKRSESDTELQSNVFGATNKRKSSRASVKRRLDEMRRKC